VVTLLRDDPTATSTADFRRACAELAEAQRRRRAKDTPAARATVAEWQAMIDRVLDRYLEGGRIGD
jgi:hypothetical protein